MVVAVATVVATLVVVVVAAAVWNLSVVPSNRSKVS